MAVPAPSRRQQEFQAYMLAARQRLLRHEVATAQQVRALYRRAAEQLRRELERIPGDTLQRRHLEALRAAIERRAEELRDELLRLSVTGIRVGAGLATEAAQEYLIDVTRGVLRAAGIRALFASVHEQAVLALLSRTLHDGLRLSDRVWRLADGVKGAITAVVEEAVAQGMDPRRAARLLHEYLRPGGYWAEPLRDETRRRMRVPRNVLHGALRLTVTELHHAFHEAANAAYQATPGVYAVEWRLSNAHVVPDVCDSLKEKGPYTPGMVPPKPHPWCRCFTVPVAEPPEQFVERLRAWVNDPASQPDIELWYRRYSEYLGGAIKPGRAAAATRRRREAETGPQAALRRFWDTVARGETLREDEVAGVYDALVAETRRRYVDPWLEQLRLEVADVERLEGWVRVWFRVTEEREGVRLGVRWATTVRWAPEKAERLERLLERLRAAPTPWDQLVALRDLHVEANGIDMWRSEAHRFAGVLKVEQARLRRELEEHDENPAEGLQLVSKLTGPAAGAIREAVVRAERWLRRLLRGPATAATKPVASVGAEHAGRAYYQRDRRHVQLYRNWSSGNPVLNLEAVAIHGFGHHWHYENPAAWQVVREWYRRRLAGPFGRVTWKKTDNEWGYVDLFTDRYIGREYEGELEQGTEAVSMGLQLLYERPLEFMFADPEHFSLVLGLAKGVGAR